MKRWYFWVLAPIMLATAFGLPFLVDPPTSQGRLLSYVISGALVLATLGLADVRRFRWALRWVASAVLVAYTWYLASEARLWWNGKPFGFGSSQAQANLMNAVGGFIAFALPSIAFLLTGRSGTDVDVLTADDGSDTP
jgi:hypothetical protein